MTAIVHLAGPLITAGEVQRQRCAWCGALIDERDLRRLGVVIEPGKSGEQMAEEVRRSQWEGLVAIDGQMRYAVPDPDDGKIPPDSCMALDPTTTT